jgi:methionyl aminopeptidase
MPSLPIIPLNLALRKMFNNNQLYKLKNKEFLEKQRIAGKVVAKSLKILEDLVKERCNKSLIELNEIIEGFILENKCELTFKGYRGFPSACCMSVNNKLVHGIPTDYKLVEGDIVKFDLGATYEGCIADAAITCIYGEPKSNLHIKMIEGCKECLKKGIEGIKIDNRIGSIGEIIYNTAKLYGLRVIQSYGGHGIDIDKDGKGVLHGSPFINNKDSRNNGMRIQEGLVICLEPMVTFGDEGTKVGEDGWSVYTKEVNAHFEHTVFIGKNGVEIITG